MNCSKNSVIIKSSKDVRRQPYMGIDEKCKIISYHGFCPQGEACYVSVQFSHSVVSDSLRLQASLSVTHSQSLLKLMSIELVMPSSHLILCRPLLLLPPIPPSIRVFPMSQLFT